MVSWAFFGLATTSFDSSSTGTPLRTGLVRAAQTCNREQARKARQAGDEGTKKRRGGGRQARPPGKPWRMVSAHLPRLLPVLPGCADGRACGVGGKQSAADAHGRRYAARASGRIVVGLPVVTD